MKTKLLLATLTIPALFAACADDDFATTAVNKTELNGQLIELDKDFAIGLTRGEEATTRNTWHYSGEGGILYSWLPTFTAQDKAAVENIGFAWRGETNDDKVRTNYKFELAGYLMNGQTSPKTKVCDGNVLVMNGYTLAKKNDGSLDISNGSIALNECKGNQMMASSYSVKYTANSDAQLIKGGNAINDILDNTKLGEKDPYVRNGIFTTDNSTIFKGEYIVYFPYNETFAEIGNLPAISPVAFEQDDANKNRVAHLAGKTFGYGKATILKGGSMAESFTTTNLSSILDFKITSKKQVNIQKIILVDEGENAKGFIKSVGLDASKIGTATGSDLYTGEPVYEPTVVLSLKNSSASNDTEKAYASIGANAAAKEFTIAVLPTAVKKPVIYLMNEKGLCLRKELDATKTWAAGKGTQYTVTIGDKDEFDQALAVDTKTFIEMLSKVGAASATEDNATVRVLGNITLDKTVEVELANTTNDKGTLNTNGGLFSLKSTKSVYIAHNVTVAGTGTITVPAEVALTLKTVEGKTLTFKTPIVVENEGCCGGRPGKMILLTAQGKKGAFVFDGDFTNYGRIWLGNNSKPTDGDDTVNATTVTFNGNLKNAIDEYSGDNAGEINCFGWKNTKINVNGQLENSGVINIENKAVEMGGTPVVTSEFTNMQAVQVNTTTVDNSGTINVGKYTLLTTTGSMVNSGEVKVESSNTGENSKDGQWKVTGSVSNTGEVENSGVINIINNGAMANASDEAVIIDHVGSQFGGSFPKVDKGEYICDVDDEDVASEGDRLGYAMGSVIPTTTIRFIGEGNTKDNGTNGYIYNLDGYKDGNVLPYNFIIEAESKVQLTSIRNIDKVGPVAQPVSIKKLTVNSALELSGIKLTAKDVVTVNGSMSVKPYGSKVNTRENDNAFIAEADVNVAAEKAVFAVEKFVMTDLNGNLTVGKNANASFDYATYTDVKNNIVVAAEGTFERKVASGGSTAIPAEVYCGNYDIKGVVTDGYPVKRN